MGFFSDKKLEKLNRVESSKKKHTILIVDDEINNLTVMKGLLSHDYHTLVANSGLEALELIQKEDTPEIHMIISDQKMPGLTGVEFLQQTIAIIPKTIRIILTAYTDVEDIIAAINNGQIYKFIVKPFERDDLKLTVKRALETYDLKDENLLLNVSNRKLTELNKTKEHLLSRVHAVYENNIKVLQEVLDRGAQQQNHECIQASRELYKIEQILSPITQLYDSEQAIRNQRILLAESNKKQQALAKLALGGTGVDLDIATNLKEGEDYLANRRYDIICTDIELIELVHLAHKANPGVHSVFMTSETAPSYLTILKNYPKISNIVSRNTEDRTFTLKNILTTISKLLGQDLFGLDKYLSWGSEVHEHAIVSSESRHNLIDIMDNHLRQVGVHRSIMGKCNMVVEELLMNAIYDAPVDAKGQSLYNHLPRTEPVHLKPEEQGTFRYACDGLLVAASVEDPFGFFDRQTILDYLERCYQGHSGAQRLSKKGGAGLGLFQIMKTSDLVVWNVAPHVKTEVIVMFNIDPKARQSNKATSFHYFSQSPN